MNTGNKLLNAITCCFKVYEEVPSSSVVSLLHGKMFELKFFFFLSSVWPAEYGILIYCFLCHNFHVTM